MAFFGREFVADLARPVTRRLPVKRLGVVTTLAGHQETDPLWRQSRRRFRTFRNRQFGTTFFVDLADYLARWHYFGGYYYDQMQFLLARRFLAGQRSCFIDIGANLGVHATTIANYCRGQCQVVAFEPNPRCFRILNANLALNGLFDVQCHNVGVGEADAVLELSGHGDNTGMYSFRPDASADVRIRVPVRRADDVLSDFTPAGPMLIKIDTEGFEAYVLKGMPQTLVYPSAALSIEVVPEWLDSTGHSAAWLFDTLYQLGYRSWLMDQGGTYANPTLSLTRIDTPVTQSSDVLFAKPAFSPELWEQTQMTLTY